MAIFIYADTGSYSTFFIGEKQEPPYLNQVLSGAAFPAMG
jgi:hypothetical protein